MQTLIIIFLLFLIYYLKIRKQLQKDKRERRLFFTLSVIGLSMPIVVLLDLPIHLLIKGLNQSLGEVTKQVIKL